MDKVSLQFRWDGPLETSGGPLLLRKLTFSPLNTINIMNDFTLNPPMRVHSLKTQIAFFQSIKSGEKTFEIRKNDRAFSVGDVLRLNEYDMYSQVYTGDWVKVEVTHMLKSLPEFGLMDGFCIMSIKLLPGK